MSNLGVFFPPKGHLYLSSAELLRAETFISDKMWAL